MTLQDEIVQCNLSVRGSEVYRYKLLFGLSLPCLHLALGFHFPAWSREHVVCVFSLLACTTYAHLCATRMYVCTSVFLVLKFLLNCVLSVHPCVYVGFHVCKIIWM